MHPPIYLSGIALSLCVCMPHIFPCFFKVPLGILEKNEAKSEDMIDILTHYQQYAPQTGEKIQAVPLGGDGLTVLHGLSAKAGRRDGNSALDRLEGVVLKSEDWHKDTITCLQVNDTNHGSGRRMD